MSTKAIRERIDGGPVVGTMILVVFFSFLLNVVDGFDVVAISVSAPYLITEWGVTRVALGPIFSIALVGMAIGAAVIAPLADRIGRRALIIFATIDIGLSMAVVGVIPSGADSIPYLMAARFVSGLGIGVIFASSAAIASEFMPDKYRNLAVTLAIMGYPFGAMVVGPAANVIIPAQGWEMLFVWGGLITLLTGAVVYFFLPESPEFLMSKAEGDASSLARVNAVLARLQRPPLATLAPDEVGSAQPSANVTSLLHRNLALDTLSLWTIYFMGFLTVYFLLSWIPTVFVDSGYSRAEGINALMLFNLGAVIGIVVIGLVATSGNLARPIGLYFFGAALMLAGLSLLRPQDLNILNAVIFVIGFLLQGAFTAMYALAARVYPASIRATGIGWAAGLGRTGAIISPIVAGLLAADGWGMYSLFLLFAVPLLISAAFVVRFRI